MGATPADAANLNPDTHGFAGVEECSDPVVVEVSESKGGAFDAFDEVVDCLGGAVSDPRFVPVRDLCMPTPQGAAQLRQLWWAVGVGEVVGEFSQVGVGELWAVDVAEVAQGFFGVPRESHFAFGITGGEQTPEFGVGVFAEAFMG